MSGGYNFNKSKFNRAVQAKRQPGSAFKPFVYLAALESGFQPNTMILDAPFVIDQGEKLGKWKPENYGKKFYGPSPLRKGIENSRNLMTIRIAQYLGMDKTVSFGAFTILMYLIKNDSASKTATLFFLVPPVSVFMAWIFINENITIADFIGLLIATLGVYIATISSLKTKNIIQDYALKFGINNNLPEFLSMSLGAA